MMKNKKIYDLIGTILTKQKDKVYGQANNAWKGQPCFKLKVQLEHEGQKRMEIYANLVNQEIWQTIEKSQFIDKRYLFKCHNYFGTYRLITWEELKD